MWCFPGRRANGGPRNLSRGLSNLPTCYLKSTFIFNFFPVPKTSILLATMQPIDGFWLIISYGLVLRSSIQKQLVASCTWTVINPPQMDEIDK